jgi:hypothetical protein
VTGPPFAHPSMSVETQQPTQPQAPGRSFLRSPMALIAGVVLALGAAVAAVLVFTGGGDDRDKTALPGATSSFTLSYPDSWAPLSKEQLANQAGHPLGVIRRKDGKGYVIVRQEAGTPPADLRKFGDSLGRQLKRRVPDLRLRSTKVIKVRAGTALFTSYIRKKTGTVQSVVVVPAGGKTYTLNTVSRGGANDVARQIGRIILSFDLKR